MAESTSTTRRPRNLSAFESLETDGLSITRPFEELVDRIRPHAVFGAPIRTDDTTVIPVASVRMGFGFGSGHGHAAQEDGGGGRGGAGVHVTPRGYIVVTKGRARYQPIRGRFGPLALAGLALAAGLLVSLASAWRP